VRASTEGGGTRGDVIVLDSSGVVVSSLRKDLVNQIDPRGLLFLDDGHLLISDNSDPNPILIATADAFYPVSRIEIAGDFNTDGNVDAADYVVWRNSVGQTGAGLAADGDASGTIDAGDYSLWRAHFGQTSGSGATAGPASSANRAAPEPSGITLAALAFASLVRRLRGASNSMPRHVSLAVDKLDSPSLRTNPPLVFGDGLAETVTSIVRAATFQSGNSQMRPFDKQHGIALRAGLRIVEAVVRTVPLCLKMAQKRGSATRVRMPRPI
jgi:hypothetical protein